MLAGTAFEVIQNDAMKESCFTLELLDVFGDRAVLDLGSGAVRKQGN